MAWQWFHRWGSPRWFYEKTETWLPWLGTVTFLLLLLGAAWGLLLAPADYKQGESYRVIYIHVPSAFLALAGYYVMAIAGAIGLIWRMKMAYMVMVAAAPLGAALTFATLATGALWGIPTWGTWWEWDGRNTSMLILLFLYLGIVALQGAFRSRDTADRACAILALVGTVNIPIIYKSVDWWHTLHQPATLKLTSAPTIHSSMLYPLLTMIVAFYCFYALVLILNTRTQILRREERTQWVAELVNQRAGRASK